MDNFELYTLANTTRNTNAITAINTDISTMKDVLFANSQMRNGIYRGKFLDITNEELARHVYNGFEDLFLGDYITRTITTDLYNLFSGESFEQDVTYYEQGGTVTARTYTPTEDTEPQANKSYYTKLVKTENVSLMIAAFNYYYNTGDTALTTPHIILIPRNQGFAVVAKMNATNTTEGGYLNSYMHQTVLPCYAASLKTALNNHVLSHRTWLSKSTNTSTASMAGAGLTGAANSAEWATVDLQLMNEVQVYGTTVWSSSAYDVGTDNRKLPVFDFITPVQFGRLSFWLRSVASSTHFAICDAHGPAFSYFASTASCVRPLIVFG